MNVYCNVPKVGPDHNTMGALCHTPKKLFSQLGDGQLESVFRASFPGLAVSGLGTRLLYFLSISPCESHSRHVICHMV